MIAQVSRLKSIGKAGRLDGQAGVEVHSLVQDLRAGWEDGNSSRISMLLCLSQNFFFLGIFLLQFLHLRPSIDWMRLPVLLKVNRL